MSKSINCFVLAAGLGERLRPITDLLPKPLLPVLGKPALAYVIEKLTTLPLRRIGINLHYKKEAVREWIESSSFSDKVLCFPEDPILDTGGALKNAESFLLGCDVFIVHNSDVISDIDLGALLDSHYSSGNMVTLAVHDRSAEGACFNTVGLDEAGYFKGVTGKKQEPDPSIDRMAAFTGIAVYNNEFLRFLPRGRSSVVDAWIKASSHGRFIGTYDVTGSYWADIGTPQSYVSAIFDALRADGETLYLHSASEGCADALLDGYVSVENGCRLRNGVSLRNCVIMPGSDLENGLYEDCIAGPGYRIFFNEDGTKDKETLIGTGGSDRKYFRVKSCGTTAVKMQCAPGDKDFMRHMEFTRFFRKFSLPVPEVLSADGGNSTALFEDFGDMSLYSWLKCRRESCNVERLYMKALDMIIKLHGEISVHVPECRMLAERVFDHEHLRWETAYFTRMFVEGVRGLRIADLPSLEDDFERLASNVDEFPRTIIHRDFQSQNIMVRQDETLGLIDYQGARLAPPAYDVVSLLWDPYHRLEDTARSRLLKYYVEGMTGPAFDAARFMETLLPCRLQRHMQALGAYGFLSNVKGKKFFLKHVPEALRMLKEEAAMAQSEYPSLYALALNL